MLRLQTNDMKRRPNIGVAALIACASSEDPKRVNGKEGATANFTRSWRQGGRGSPRAKAGDARLGVGDDLPADGEESSHAHREGACDHEEHGPL